MLRSLRKAMTNLSSHVRKECNKEVMINPVEGFGEVNHACQDHERGLKVLIIENEVDQVYKVMCDGSLPLFTILLWINLVTYIE